MKAARNLAATACVVFGLLRNVVASSSVENFVSLSFYCTLFTTICEGLPSKYMAKTPISLEILSVLMSILLSVPSWSCCLKARCGNKGTWHMTHQ